MTDAFKQADESGDSDGKLNIDEFKVLIKKAEESDNGKDPLWGYFSSGDQNGDNLLSSEEY